MLKFDKITKKQAIESLKENKNVLIDSLWLDYEKVLNVINENYEKVENKILERINNNTLKIRKAEKIQSNAIKFTYGSWLYFNSFDTAYKHENWLLLVSENNTIVYRLF